MNKENIPSIITRHFPEMKCHNCSCVIDIDGFEPFAKIECPKCNELTSVPAGFDNFTLLDILGSGQMGSVYLAKDNTLNRNVAIKVMLPSLSESEEFVETFTHEAQALAQLNHPNIAQIYSFGEKNGQQYLVMELVKGKKLEDLMRGKKQVDQALAMHVCLQVVKGLQVVGEAGLVHGDVKPENIVVDTKMKAKLVDFGLAIFDKDGPRDGIWGSPYYIAPEKLLEKRLDVRSDIYSLGATLYHAIAGKPPFVAPTPEECINARLKRDPRDIALLRRDINQDVRNIIMRMLERDPFKRYPASCTSLIGDMTKAIKELGGVNKSVYTKVNIRSKTKIMKGVASRQMQATSASASDPAKSKPKKNPLKAIMIILFFLICLGVVVAVYVDKQRRKKVQPSPDSFSPIFSEAAEKKKPVGPKRPAGKKKSKKIIENTL